jgi:hypothetical protein
MFSPKNSTDKNDKVYPINPNTHANAKNMTLIKVLFFVLLYHTAVIIQVIKAKTTAAKALVPFNRVLS